MTRFALILIFAALCGGAVLAQHAKHGQPMPAGAVAELPSVKEFSAVNAKMHDAMAIAYTGHADIDFLRGMIPHHQGAIDMARIVLKHGHDEQVKKLAHEIIAAQEHEITMMKAQLQALKKERGSVQ